MIKSTLFLLAALMFTAATFAAQSSDTFQTQSGKSLVIHHIKHGSLYIEYEGMYIYVDPVGTTAQPATDYRLLPKASLILITHEHQDHFDQLALNQLWNTGTPVYAPKSVIEKLHRGVSLANGDSIEYNGIHVRAVPAYNTTEGRERFHPKGRDNGYIITIDGLRIYIAGDTEPIPEMSELGPVDVAFLPCNQPYTMTIDQLDQAARTVKPRVLYPYHYSETPISQARMRLAGSGIEVRIRDYK